MDLAIGAGQKSWLAGPRRRNDRSLLPPSRHDCRWKPLEEPAHRGTAEGRLAEADDLAGQAENGKNDPAPGEAGFSAIQPIAGPPAASVPACPRTLL